MTRFVQDPTGTVAGMMNNKVFSNTDFARAISPGAVVVLKQVHSDVWEHFDVLLVYLSAFLSLIERAFTPNLQFFLISLNLGF